jgi:hypothetical protein
MSEFRLWVHEQIARLDGTRERRFVALAAALIFASLALGPQALHAIDDAVNAPDIRIEELGPNPVSNPVRFKATTVNVQLGQVEFLVMTPDNTMTIVPGHRTSSTDPSLWESQDFVGVPGNSYVVKARGFSPTSGTAVESRQPVTFAIFDPSTTQGSGTNTSGATGTGTTGTGTTGTTTAGTVDIIQLVAWPGTEPRIEARGQHNGFIADSAYFRVQSISGLAFLGEYEADRENTNGWHATFAVPGGSIYRVILIARPPGVGHESIPRDVSVPVAETAPPPTAPPATPTPPPPSTLPPAVALLLPSAGAELLSPATFAARVTNATATSVMFEVLDPAGMTRQLQGGPGTGGDWTATFMGEPGQYAVGVRTTLSTGTVIPPSEYRPFKILPPPTPAEPPVAGTEPPPATTPDPAPTVTEPSIEVFSPPEAAPPYPGPVAVSVRVHNGLPERVAAVVTGPNGGEIIVIASKTPTGDFWNAIFEGPDGEYRFRIRALVGGKDLFSPERRFSVKRPTTTTAPPPPPTPTAPPAPAPTPTPTSTTPPPPPPPQPTGSVPPPDGAPANAETGSGAVSGITVDARDDGVPSTSAPQVPEELAFECRQAGILPTRCADWLKAKYQNRECLDAGAVTREACAALLGRLNIASDESKLIGLASRGELAQAREDALKVAGEPVRRDALPPSIAALLPAAADPSAIVRVFAVANPKEDSSPGILVQDADGDGLPDDMEKRIGTDPAAADTDGDGFSDGTEVKNGYNPLGPGALGAPLRGVERALIDGRSLEEPRGAETLVDASFTIEAADVPTPAEEDEDLIRLSGVAAPNSVVTIFVYSYLPIVVTTTTDENGNWTYDFGSKLAEGRHEAYVSVNDDTGKLVAASSPLAFFVKEAQAVSEEDFLRPDVNVEAATPSLSRWFIYGGIALVALALFLVIAIVRQVRKSPVSGSGDGV